MGVALGLVATLGAGAAGASAPPFAEETPRASSYSLTPLLTGGILETKREVTLTQGVSQREAEPDPDNCNPYADGQLSVSESMQVTGLVDLGYPEVPRATNATSEIPASDVRMSGSATTQGANWGCEGDPPRNFLVAGGTCTRSFRTPPEGGSLIEPRPREGFGNYYEPGVSRSVFGVTYYDSGLDCLMNDGRVPFAPGLFIHDYWWDSQTSGAFTIPLEIAKQDKGTAEGSLGATDSSCLYGSEWWEGAHGSGIYTWVTPSYGGEPNDSKASTCSSVRTGLSRTSIERALVVNEVRLFQMTPAGDYKAVGPTEKVVDGNTVKIEMLIENRWKRDITAPIQLWDSKYKRKLEPEKGQQNPFNETFMAGGQKKVTFLWRSDGVAWEDAKPELGRDIAIMTPYGGAKFSVFVQARTALLVHGWNSDADTWHAWPGFVASTRGDAWYVKAVTGMNTNPRSGNSIQQNAQYLARAIQAARTATGSVHVDLVVHSMGGLISRWYLGNLMGGPTADGRPIVRTLTMFGTPHQGSDCATGILANVASQYVTEQGGDYRLSEIAAAFARGTSHVPTIQLTPAYLNGPFLNATTRPVKGVYYSHLTGNPIKFFACGIYGNQEGPNDGAVVVPSSNGGGRGGKPLAPPLPVVHISLWGDLIIPKWAFNGVGMTEEPSFYNIALADVLGLGPDKAPKLVGTGVTRRGVSASASPPVARAVVAGAARGQVGQTITLAKPEGDFELIVLAPAGTTVTAVGPAGQILTGSGGASLSGTVSGEAGTITITPSGGSTGEVEASLISASSWFDVTTSRSRGKLVVTATIPDRKTTILEAVIVSGTAVGKVVRLTGKRGKFSATLPLARGDAPVVIVKGARGKAFRLVTTSG
ncbi:MAG: esterase/lipase family protein [bacterium]